MKYKVRFSKEFEKSITKLRKKDKKRFSQIQKKIEEIINHPEHFKPLRNELKGFRRLHFGPFVLIYKIEDEKIRIISLDHHDKAY